MIRLRELSSQDIPLLNSWRNDEEVTQYLGSPHRHITREVDNRWYESYLQARDRNIRLAIVATSEKAEEFVGCANLTSVDWINRTAEFSIVIGVKSHWGQGTGTLATIAATRHAFFDLNLNRLYLYVIEGNHRARHVYKKCGYTEEGLLRSAVFKQNEYVNLVLMAALRDYWAQPNVAQEIPL